MLLLLLACNPCSKGEFASGDGCYADAGLRFAGVSSLSWDGADGLLAAWDPAEAAVAPVQYEITVWDAEGTQVAQAEESGNEHPISGLADGMYRVRVVAFDALGRSGGWDRVLEQLVAENRLVYRGERAMNGGARSLAGSGNLIALGGGGAAAGEVALVDASDPENPQTLSTIANLGQVGDVEVHDNLLFVAVDTTLDPNQEMAVGVYDIADPSAPTLISTITRDQDSAHTVSWGGDHLFLAATAKNQDSAWSFADPAHPELDGAWAPPPSASTGGVHDQVWQNGLLYSAYTRGFGIIDFSDATHPLTISTTEADWPSPFVHNLAVTADGTVMAMSEEAVGGGLRIWDLSVIDAPQLLSSFRTDENHSIHNVGIRNGVAFCAWYVDGVLALDLADPANPVLNGWYDSYDGPEDVETRSDGTLWPNVSGATNVWLGGPHVAVSDQQRGLLLFDYYATVVTAPD